MTGGRILRALLLAAALAGGVAEAQTAGEAELSPAIELELDRFVALLATGAGVTAETVGAAEELGSRAAAAGTRAVRVRGTEVAFLARELLESRTETERTKQALLSAAEADRAIRADLAARRRRGAGFWVSLGVGFAGAIVASGSSVLGEASYASYASSSTSGEAAAHRRRADIWSALAIGGAAAWGIGLGGTLLFTILGGATSPP